MHSAPVTDLVGHVEPDIVQAYPAERKSQLGTNRMMSASVELA